MTRTMSMAEATAAIRKLAKTAVDRGLPLSQERLDQEVRAHGTAKGLGEQILMVLVDMGEFLALSDPHSGEWRIKVAPKARGGAPAAPGKQGALKW